jgi:hypothetical protein
MKKHLVAFLSMIGLAGPAVPVHGQVLKGSKEPVKKESQIKQNKQVQENKAAQTQVQDKRKDKWAKADTEKKLAKSDAEIKGEKTAGEKKAVKDQSKLKLQQDTLRKQNSASGQKNALTKGALTKGALTKAKTGEQK